MAKGEQRSNKEKKKPKQDKPKDTGAKPLLNAGRSEASGSSKSKGH